MASVTVLSEEAYRQEITAGPHRLLADEPVSAGGTDTGPDPYQLLLAALGACTSITMRMYAERKGWDLRTVRVELNQEQIHAADCADCEATEGRLDHIEKRIYVSGDLSSEQTAQLLQIAQRCPINLTLQREVSMDDAIELEIDSDHFPGQA